jgi:hypothetical protein
MAVKFGWNENETKLYNSLMNAASCFGMGSGSLAGGFIIPIGRRKTIIYFNFLSIIATCLTLNLNIWSIIAGKLLYGFSSGVINIACPKMLDETVPLELIGGFGIATNTFICVGIFFGVALGMGLPEEGDIEAYAKDEYWRVMYGFPILFSVLLYFCLLNVLK